MALSIVIVNLFVLSRRFMLIWKQAQLIALLILRRWTTTNVRRLLQAEIRRLLLDIIIATTIIINIIQKMNLNFQQAAFFVTMGGRYTSTHTTIVAIVQVMEVVMLVIGLYVSRNVRMI